METNRTPWRLAIGEPFTPERTKWPHNRFEFRYFDGSYLLQINEASPGPRSIEAFRFAPMHIGLHFERNVIFFLFKIQGSWEWSDQAFSIHLVPAEDRGPGDASDKHFVPLSVVLVDADTGLVRALRVVTMSPRFVVAFQRFIAVQKAAPFSRAEHEAAIGSVYARYTASKDLAAAAMYRERAGSNLA